MDFSDPNDTDASEFDVAGIDAETKRIADPGQGMPPSPWPPDMQRSKHPIQFMREHLGITAKELADLIGAPKNTVIAWEQKPWRPRPTKWSHLWGLVQLARRNRYYFSLEQLYRYCDQGSKQ